METLRLKEKDNTSKSIPRHKMKSAVDDEFETPDDLYYSLADHYDIVCELDVFSGYYYINDVKKTNSKCINHFTIDDNALEIDWLLPDGKKPTGIFENDPHSLHKECLHKTRDQWLELDLDILSIIPGNTVRPHYWYEYVQQYLNKGLIVEPLINWYKPPEERDGYIEFLQNGKPSEYGSRNGYLVIRYFSKRSWTRFLKKSVLDRKDYALSKHK